MKQRHRKHIVLKRMKKFCKFFWRWSELKRQDRERRAGILHDILKDHDGFRRGLERTQL